MSGRAQRISSVTRRRDGSSLKTARSPRPAHLYSAPIIAAAAAMIGAEYRCAGLGDLAVFNDDPSRRRVTELIRWARPDIVVTASPVDYHPDHEATSMLVRDACFAC